MYFVGRAGRQHLNYSSNLFGVCIYLPLVNDEVEEFTRADSESTLGMVEMHVELPQLSECLSQVCQVGAGKLAFYDHVVNVNLHAPPNLVLEHFVDCFLVCCSSILQPEGHDLVIVDSSVGDEVSVLLIFRSHFDFIIPQESIYKCEELVP